MITRADIAKAVREADAEAEGGDFASYWRDRAVDLNGLSYVAEQRALRICMIMQGLRPDLDRPVEVRMTKTMKDLFPLFAGAFMDGFAAGLKVGRGD